MDSDNTETYSYFSSNNTSSAGTIFFNVSMLLFELYSQ